VGRGVSLKVGDGVSPFFVGRSVGRSVGRFVGACEVGLTEGLVDGPGVGDNVGWADISHGGGTSGHSMKLLVQHSGLPFL